MKETQLLPKNKPTDEQKKGRVFGNYSLELGRVQIKILNRRRKVQRGKSNEVRGADG